MEVPGRRIDFPNHELSWNGASLRLTLMEAQLLRYLIQRQGNVVSRKAILEEVWGCMKTPTLGRSTTSW